MLIQLVSLPQELDILSEQVKADTIFGRVAEHTSDLKRQALDLNFFVTGVRGGGGEAIRETYS